MRESGQVRRSPTSRGGGDLPGMKITRPEALIDAVFQQAQQVLDLPAGVPDVTVVAPAVKIVEKPHGGQRCPGNGQLTVVPQLLQTCPQIVAGSGDTREWQEEQPG